jgi:eukaryotic-like serine/threonine-protein kinase
MSVTVNSKIWLDGPNKQMLGLGTLIKSGGAGSVYQIRETSAQVAKIYHAGSALAEYERKIIAMLSLSPNLPNINEPGQNYVQIAWPQAIIRNERGRFLGFTMPALDIKATSELEYILQERQARAEGLPTGLGAKITLAANLSAVIAELHRQQHYVVDMKPVNLRFYRRSLYMAMLDCDGFSIQGQGERFKAPQYTPDYLAPEFQVSGITNDGEEQQDRFALAVLIFQLLNFGIHPFTGRPRSDRVPTDIPGRIKTRSYAYGIKPSKTITPSLVSGHEAISLPLRKLFDRAFESTGLTRPSASEWANALKPYAEKSSGSLIVCVTDREHQHFSGLSCAACQRNTLLKKARAATTANTTARKPFPAGPAKRRIGRRQNPATYRIPATIYQPKNTASPSPSFFSYFNWRVFYAYPSITIIVLFLIGMRLSSCDVSSSNEQSETASYGTTEQEYRTRIKQLEEKEKQRRLEMENKIITANDVYDAKFPVLPPPNLTETSGLITNAATGMAKGDNILAYRTFQTLLANADNQRKPYPESQQRYARLLNTYLSSDEMTPNSIEGRQTNLKEQLELLVFRDPMLGEAAIELAWLHMIDNKFEDANRLYQQTIMTQPHKALAWHGLGISMIRNEDDDVLIGIFTIAQILRQQHQNDAGVSGKMLTLSFQVPESEKKRLSILQARANQLADNVISQGFTFERVKK